MNAKWLQDLNEDLGRKDWGQITIMQLFNLVCKKWGYAHKGYWAIYTFFIVLLTSLCIFRKNDNVPYKYFFKRKLDWLWVLDYNTGKVNGIMCGA